MPRLYSSNWLVNGRKFPISSPSCFCDPIVFTSLSLSQALELSRSFPISELCLFSLYSATSLPYIFCLSWGGLFLSINLGHLLYPGLPSWFQASVPATIMVATLFPGFAHGLSFCQGNLYVCWGQVGGNVPRLFLQCLQFFRLLTALYTVCF